MDSGSQRSKMYIYFEFWIFLGSDVDPALFFFNRIAYLVFAENQDTLFLAQRTPNEKGEKNVSFLDALASLESIIWHD